MLVAGLILVSVGSVFAQNSTDAAVARQSNPVSHTPWRALFGNVTTVNGNNITIATKYSGNVVVMLTEITRCEILGNTGWLKLDEFTSKLGGNLSALEGDSVAVVAIDVQGAPGSLTGDAVLFVVMKPIIVMPIHQTTGIVTAYTPYTAGRDGNITIKDIHGASYSFIIGNDTRYNPGGMGPGNITVNKSFVTVVSRGKLNAGPVAKMIVIYNMIPQGWLQLLNRGINKPMIPFGNMTIPPTRMGLPTYQQYAGNVTYFAVDSSGNGNITITAIHGTAYGFIIIGNETRYCPAGTGPGNITVGSFVTVVSKSETNAQPVAETIALYKGIPRGWPMPSDVNLGMRNARDNMRH
jgi:hypothetical protein